MDKLVLLSLASGLVSSELIAACNSNGKVAATHMSIDGERLSPQQNACASGWLKSHGDNIKIEFTPDTEKYPEASLRFESEDFRGTRNGVAIASYNNGMSMKFESLEVSKSINESSSLLVVNHMKHDKSTPYQVRNGLIDETFESGYFAPVTTRDGIKESFSLITRPCATPAGCFDGIIGASMGVNAAPNKLTYTTVDPVTKRVDTVVPASFEDHAKEVSSMYAQFCPTEKMAKLGIAAANEDGTFPGEPDEITYQCTAYRLKEGVNYRLYYSKAKTGEEVTLDFYTAPVKNSKHNTYIRMFTFVDGKIQDVQIPIVDGILPSDPTDGVAVFDFASIPQFESPNVYAKGAFSNSLFTPLTPYAMRRFAKFSSFLPVEEADIVGEAFDVLVTNGNIPSDVGLFTAAIEIEESAKAPIFHLYAKSEELIDQLNDKYPLTADLNLYTIQGRELYSSVLVDSMPAETHQQPWFVASVMGGCVALSLGILVVMRLKAKKDALLDSAATRV